RSGGRRPDRVAILVRSLQHMSAERSSSPSITSVPPPAAGRAIGRRPRMSRFFRILVGITALTHIPFVVAVFEAARRFFGADDRLAWCIACAFGLAGVTLFIGRAR